MVERWMERGVSWYCVYSKYIFYARYILKNDFFLLFFYIEKFFIAKTLHSQIKLYIYKRKKGFDILLDTFTAMVGHIKSSHCLHTRIGFLL